MRAANGLAADMGTTADWNRAGSSPLTRSTRIISAPPTESACTRKSTRVIGRQLPFRSRRATDMRQSAPESSTGLEAYPK
jgi:hypothetical protein